MTGLSKKRSKLHQAATIAIVTVYLFIAASVDLFHTEDCVFGDRHSRAADSIYSDAPCPACAFLAGHHSMGINYAPALLNAEFLFAPQSMSPLAVICSNEWAYSIVSRAPPSLSLS
jgi:hypothetical protein